MKVHNIASNTNPSELKVLKWLEDKVFSKDVNNEIDYCIANYDLRPKDRTDGEIDFLLVGKAGLFVFEIKGDHDISVKNGQWFYGTRKDKSALKQASDNFWELNKQLKQKGILQSANGYYACVIPNMQINSPIDPSYPESMYFDSRVEFHFADYIKALISLKKRKYGGSELSSSELDKIWRYLRPDYIRSIADGIATEDNRVIRLSDAQFEIINIDKDHPRMLIQGPAGSGKTVLALQMMQQNEKEKIKSVYICHNIALGEKICFEIEKLVGGKPKYITVAWDDKLGKIREKFDYLIADEAQDYFNDEKYLEIDNILNGGLEKGRFRIFLDESQNIFSSIDFEFLDDMRKKDDVIKRRLRYNFRNTIKIRDYIENKTKLDVGLPLNNPEGFDPEIRKIPYVDNVVDYQAYSRSVSDLINTLLDQGVNPKDIMIIPVTKFDYSIVNDKNIKNIKLKHGVKTAHCRGLNWGKLSENKTIVYGSAAQIKGIDSSIVICTDLFNKKTEFEEAKKMLMLVGMTRARSKLYLFVGKNY